MGVSRVLEGSHKGVRALHRNFKGVTKVLQGCYNYVTTVLLSFYKDVVRVFHWCFNDVIMVLLGFHKGVSWV